MKGIIEADFNTSDGREVFRHSTAHIMAMAVKSLYPDAKIAIGPALENGFYYDVDVPEHITPEILDKIEKRMNEFIQKDIPFEREELSKEKAIELFEKRDETYKVEIIKGIPAETVSIYKNGDFIDLCRGPHLPSTGKVKAIKLLSVSGAYWRGLENNPMLQRIYGTCFDSEKNLRTYLRTLEEAKKRDHRKLGKELHLFSFHEEGPGLPFWLPKGVTLKNCLIDYWRQEHVRAGYKEIQTPIILRQKLWETSGHLENYRENMYLTEVEKEGYAIKPMNCPGGMLVYKETLQSYRDLPLRLCELGNVHRHERSGVLQGLFRVRSFTQDDAHIFITEDQIKDEIIEIVQLIDRFYKLFGFEYEVDISTKPDKYIGSDQLWEKATAALEDALKESGVNYTVMPGAGAFYGPKIDFQLIDSLGRPHQCATVQLDMNLPERFDLKYRGQDGKDHKPVVLHRVIYGSLERFLGILIEHYGGLFPLWLSPVQARVMNISDSSSDYAKEIHQALLNANIRSECDLREEKIGLKVRESEKQKTPYMIVVGDKEKEEKTISLRKHKEGDLGKSSIDELIQKLKQEIENKVLPQMEKLAFQKRSAKDRSMATRDY